MHDAEISYSFGDWTINVYSLPECEFVHSRCKEPGEDGSGLGEDFDHSLDYLPGDAEVVGGMIKIRRNGKYGFCSRYGEHVVPCNYDYAGQFEGGLCVVGIAGRHGIIDAVGNIVVPLEHASIYRHYETPNLAFALPGKYLIDVPERKPDVSCYPYANGGIRCLMEVDELSVYMPGVPWRNSDKLLIRSGGRYGIIDCAGKVCASLVYDMIQHNGIAERDGKTALLDAEGREVLPPVFDSIRKIHPHSKISGDMRGDFAIAARKTHPGKVFTSNGLFLCDVPIQRYTAGALINHIIETCSISRLAGQHFLVRAENTYGVIQKAGVCGDTNCGQAFIGFCELVPFIWDAPDACMKAYQSVMESPCPKEKAGHEIDVISEELVGPFRMAHQMIMPGSVVDDGFMGKGDLDGIMRFFTSRDYDRDGSLSEAGYGPFRAYGVYNSESESIALNMEYRRFAYSYGVNNERYHGVTALKNQRWYYVEITKI